MSLSFSEKARHCLLFFSKICLPSLIGRLLYRILSVVVLFVQVVLEKFRCKWKNEVGVRRDDDNDQSSIVPVADVEEFDTVKRVRIFLSALFLMLTFSRRF